MPRTPKQPEEDFILWASRRHPVYEGNLVPEAVARARAMVAAGVLIRVPLPPDHTYRTGGAPAIAMYKPADGVFVRLDPRSPIRG